MAFNKIILILFLFYSGWTQGKLLDADFYSVVSKRVFPPSEQLQSSPVNQQHVSSKLDSIYSNPVPSSDLQSMAQSVFRIENDLFVGKKGGTAFYIGNNRFVTSFHVVSGSIGADLTPLALFLIDSRVSTSQKKMPFQRVVDFDLKRDLAILELNHKDFRNLERSLIPLKISSVPTPPSLQGGLVYGFPSLSGYFVFKKLYVIGDGERQYEGEMLAYLNGFVPGGASGSPLLLDNEVVGVLKSGSGNAVFFVPSQHLFPLLQPSPRQKGILHLMKESAKIGKGLIQKDKESVQVLRYNTVLNPLAIAGTKFLLKRWVQNNESEKIQSFLLHPPFLAGLTSFLEIKLIKILYDKGHEKEAIERLKKLAKVGFNQALFTLALIAMKRGHESDALKLYELSAWLGDGFASHVLGLYKANPEVQFSEQFTSFSAEEWFYISLQQNYLPVVFELHDLYFSIGNKEKYEQFQYLIDLLKDKEKKGMKRAYETYQLRKTKSFTVTRDFLGNFVFPQLDKSACRNLFGK